MSAASFGLRELTGRKNGMLGVLRLKGCPRCNGDMVVEKDEWGWYEQCIQCGHLHDLQGGDDLPLVDGTVYDTRKGSLSFATPTLETCTPILSGERIEKRRSS